MLLERSTIRVTSVIARIEVQRAVADRDPGSVDRAARLLVMLSSIGIDDGVVATAATLRPLALPARDAIHLASAMRLGPELDAFVTYDRRLAEVARDAGLHVESPGVDLDIAPASLATLDPSTLQRVADRLVGRLRPARIVLPAGDGGGRVPIVVVLGPWSPGRAASQLGREAIADLGADVDVTIIDDEDAETAPPGATLYDSNRS